jgi:hypothetical protein
MKVKFYGNMEWFDTDDELPSPVPEFLKTARELWEKDQKKNRQRIIDLLSPYLKSYFVPAGISDSEDLFPRQDDVPASEVKIVDVRFKKKNSYIPECRAEAWYEVEVSELFTEIDLDAWQEDRGEFFHQAVSFAWAIPKGKNKMVELTYGSHSGVECSPELLESSADSESTKDFVENDSEIVSIRLTGLDEKLGKSVRDFLKENWSDEIRNFKDVMSSKGACEIHVSTDDASILCSILIGKVTPREVVLRCG